MNQPTVEELDVSTRMIICETSLEFDMKQLFDELPLETKDETKFRILGTKFQNEEKGALENEGKKKKKKNNFRNSLCVIIKNLHSNTCLNLKISKHGKIQITGCKDTINCFEAIEFFVELLIQKCASAIFKFASVDLVQIKFIIIMTNLIYNCGFKVDKLKICRLIRSEPSHEFIDLSCTDFGYTGLNIKLRQKENILSIPLHTLHRKTMSWKREKTKYHCDFKKPKFNTFLIFNSGKIIISGMQEQTMKNDFNFFSEYIVQNKDSIVEKFVT